MSLVDALGPWPRSTALFDVRDLGEAFEQHIVGATFLPRSLIEFRAERLVPDKASPIVLYDDNFGRAELALETFAELGYANARVLPGGIAQWKATGGATESGANVSPKRFGERVLHEDSVPSIKHDDIGPGDLWDVRTPREFENGSLPGSRSGAGFDTIFAAAGAEGQRIQLHCAGRTRSIIAARTLALMGHDAVAVEDGAMGWLLAGRSLQRGPAVAVPAPPAELAAAVEAAARRLCDSAGVARVSRAGAFARLIDVRGEAAFLAGHMPGAECLPGAQAVQRADDFLPLGDAEIVCVDEHEARAIVTAYWLRRMGFRRACVLAGGLARWRAEGGALELGKAPKRPTLKHVDLPNDFGRRTLIDVSDRRSFATAHAEGARRIPRGWLELRIDRLATAGAAALVFASDERQATFAAATLRRRGYDAAPAALEAWRAAGGEIAHGPDPDDDFPADEIVPPYAQGAQAMRRYLEWEKAL